MTAPTALVLDEPFSGLDPQAVDAMADLLREHAAPGGAGALLLPPARPRRAALRPARRPGRRAGRGRRARPPSCASRGGCGTGSSLGSDAGWVRGIEGVSVLDVDGATAVLELLAADAADRVLREALARGSVHELSPLVPTLSEIYREVTA